MKTRLLTCSVAVAALLLSAGTVLAGDVEETFANLTATAPNAAPTTGGSTITGFEFSDTFGPPDVTLVDNATTKGPGSPDSKYLSWNGSTDQYLVTSGTGITSVAVGGNTIYFAIPIRVDTLAPVLANNTIDIIFVGTAASSLFGLTVDAGVLRMAGSNSYSSVVLSNTAFDSNALGNWGDAQWRVLAGKLNPQTNGTGAATWWVLEGPSLNETQLVSVSNVTNARTAVAGVDLLGFGASLDVPAGTTTAISVDNVSFYTTAFAADVDFLNAVKADYSPASSVDNWTVFH